MSNTAAAGGGGAAGSVVPRNFKLLDELEEAEKGGKSGADISLGLQNADDTFMNNWQASIFQAAGGGADLRLWSLTLTVDAHYPRTPPVCKFTSKVIMECVDSKGNIIVAKVPYLATWNLSKTMHGVLTEIKGLLGKAPLSQPSDGTNF